MYRPQSKTATLPPCAAALHWIGRGRTHLFIGKDLAAKGRRNRTPGCCPRPVLAAWAYRHPARVGRDKQPKVAAAPRRVREIAWKAQTRLSGRFRSLLRKGKLPTVVVTA